MVIYFDEVQDEYGFMSNYQESPFTIDEKEYATNEHYFQSQKFEEIEK